MNKKIVVGVIGLLLLFGSGDTWSQRVKTETGDVVGDTLHEVMVTSRSAQKRMEEVQIGVEQIEVEALAKMPSLFRHKT